MDETILRSYIPAAFWAMDPVVWQGYVSEVKGDDRQVLSHYPFKWASAHPSDPQGAIDFLCDIGVDDGQVSLDSVEEQLANLPTFESLVSQGSVDWEEPRGDDIPPGGFRMIPEWEPMAGTLINWPTFYPPLWETFRKMVGAVSHATVFLRIPEGCLGAGVLAWLGVKGIDLNVVRPVPGPVGDIWARDYSPVYGVNRYTGEPTVHKFSFAAFYPEYRMTFRSIVDIDNRFAWVKGYKVYRTEIMYDGGYLLTDGNGTYVMTRRVLSDNSAIPNLYARLETWLGAERLIIIDEEPGDALGHINHIKFVSPQKVLVGMPDDEASPLFRYYVDLHRLFAEHGYEVVAVPCPVGRSRLLPIGWQSAHLYANSLMLNHRVLVCQYGRGFERYDEEAVIVYREALPDYEVVPIDCSILANGGGGINCATHEIPDIKRLGVCGV